jgi:hypothetical protein
MSPVCSQPSLQRLRRGVRPLPVFGHHVAGAHADLAGLAGRDFLVVIVENLDLAGGDRESAGQKQLRRLGIVVGLAQHRHRIAFGLAVELREHRPDPLDALDQPARRHRGRAIQQQFERGEVGLVERGMIQHHVDHRRHEQA